MTATGPNHSRTTLSANERLTVGACVAGAIISALLPYALPLLFPSILGTFLGLVGGPLLFGVFLLGAFVTSGRSRHTWWLLLLLPICLWYPLQVLAMIVIWSIRGSMV